MDLIIFIGLQGAGKSTFFRAAPQANGAE